MPEVVGLCLNNPHHDRGAPVQGHQPRDTRLDTILMIAHHPALVAAAARPLLPRRGIRIRRFRSAVQLHKTMKLVDLRELYADPSLPVTSEALCAPGTAGAGN